jgi:hypothetical protein
MCGGVTSRTSEQPLPDTITCAIGSSRPSRTASGWTRSPGTPDSTRTCAGASPFGRSQRWSTAMRSPSANSSVRVTPRPSGPRTVISYGPTSGRSRSSHGSSVVSSSTTTVPTRALVRSRHDGFGWTIPCSRRVRWGVPTAAPRRTPACRRRCGRRAAARSAPAEAAELLARPATGPHQAGVRRHCAGQPSAAASRSTRRAPVPPRARRGCPAPAT